MRRGSIILPDIPGSLIDDFLESIRQNSVVLSKAHKDRFIYLDSTLKYYKIPIIVLSGVSSVVSFSQTYIPQNAITVSNALLGLVCSVICSVELYLGISREMASCESASKDFYILSIEIQKFLKTNGSNFELGRTFLEQSFGQYSALFENSYVVKVDIMDKLIVLPTEDIEAPSPRGFIERTNSIISNLVKSSKI